MFGYPEDYFEGCEDENREANLQRVADNSSNDNALGEILQNLKSKSDFFRKSTIS